MTAEDQNYAKKYKEWGLSRYEQEILNGVDLDEDNDKMSEDNENITTKVSENSELSADPLACNSPYNLLLFTALVETLMFDHEKVILLSISSVRSSSFPFSFNPSI